MADSVLNLFGIDPAALQQQRATTDFANAFRFAQLDPLQRANLSIYQGSAGIGRGINQLLGGDAELNKATKVRELASQFDMTSADGLRQFAQAVSPFAPDVAQQAIKRSDEMTTTGLQQTKLIAEAVRAAREPGQINMQQLLSSGKYTPASVAKYKETGNPADLVATGEKLEASTMKEIATAEKNNSILTKTNTTLDDYINKVENNKIIFNIGRNILSWTQRQTGTQDQNTLDQLSLKKFLENERNNILLAAKGTQTEGDAQRAMSQIFDQTDWTSNASVQQALSDLKTYKQSQIEANDVFINTLKGPRKTTAQPPATGETTKNIYSIVRSRQGWTDATDAEIDAAIKAGKIKVPTGK